MEKLEPVQITGNDVKWYVMAGFNCQLESPKEESHMDLSVGHCLHYVK